MFATPRFDSAGARRSATILLVEDEALVRLSLAEHLRDSGFEVLEAKSGDSAKDICAAKDHIDLVFTDVQMPGRIDGLALARWLHETHPAIDLMITSGNPEMTDRAGELCDAGSVFAKPYDREAVIARIQTLLN